MRILMFGWEFPPFNTGGLGTACYGLTKGLSRQGVDLTLVLPHMGDGVDVEYLKILPADIGKNIRIRRIDSVLKPYVTSESYLTEIEAIMAGEGVERASMVVKDVRKGINLNVDPQRQKKALYGSDLFHEVYRYAKDAKRIALEEAYDIIHCHDWLTYPAGIQARDVAAGRGMNVPLIAHIHATELDRTGGNPNQLVYDIEREGMHKANYVLAVSQYTKDIVVDRYAVDPGKVHVVHNSIDIDEDFTFKRERTLLNKHHKIVLFLGRMTLQKGPDHFLNVAKKISEMDDKALFVMAGGGDMFSRMVERAADLGIADKVLFTEHLSGADVERAYQMADVYVMSSVSEPFGLTVLESIKNGTPVVVSKQSGVSEVVKNCLVVDFWDTCEMANKIYAVLNYPSLSESLASEGLSEIMNFSWDVPAKKCIDVYEKAFYGGER